MNNDKFRRFREFRIKIIYKATSFWATTKSVVLVFYELSRIYRKYLLKRFYTKEVKLIFLLRSAIQYLLVGYEWFCCC